MTLSVADTTDTFLRFDTLNDDTHWDAQTTPSASLDLSTRRTSYTLRYAPNFSLFYIGEDATYDPETGEQDLGQQWAINHNVNLGATLRFRTTSVSLNQRFSYGQRNYRFDLAPVGEVPPNGEPAPPDDEGPTTGVPGETPIGQQGAKDVIVTLGSSTTTLGVGHSVTRRANVYEFVSYEISVPMDEKSRAVYPLQRGFTVGAGVGYQLTRRDHLNTSLTGELFYTEPIDQLPVRSRIAELREDWSREWFQDFITTFGVGVSYARTKQGEHVTEVISADFGPSGNAGIEYTWGYRGAVYTLSGNFGSAPEVDRFTGIVDPRFFWGGSLSRSERRLTLAAAITGAQSADPGGEAPLASFGASLTAYYEAVERLTLRAGASTSAFTNIAFTEGFPSPDLYTVFMGLGYSFLPIKF
jgi:hypothetical protein